MRKYTSAPKDVADSIKNSIPVSEAAALGEGWKKLPKSTDSPIKATKKISARSAPAMHLSAKKAADNVYNRRKTRASGVHIETDTVEFTFGGVRFKAQGTPSASYGKGLAKAVKDYIKAHPVKS